MIDIMRKLKVNHPDKILPMLKGDRQSVARKDAELVEFGVMAFVVLRGTP
jgi:hypothetical protein